MRIGIDLVVVERVATLLSEHPKTAAKLFADVELVAARALDGPRRDEFLAGRFAVKEAFFKAVGGPKGIDPRDVACVVVSTRAPRLELGSTAVTALNEAGCGHVAVSISHDAGFATAAVLAY